jgi:transcriptional antiterminator NusG
MIDGEIIGVSTAFQQGDSIVITDGPLLGMEGNIQFIDKRKGRVRVNLSFLGDKRTVDLSIKLIDNPSK